MTRRNRWIPSPRVGVIILCMAVALVMGYWAGWDIAHTPGPTNMTGAEIGFAVMAGISCVFIIMAMAFVRAVFKFHSVRILFDVFAVVLWAMIVFIMVEALLPGASYYGTVEGVPMTPMMTFVFTVGSVLIVTVLNLSLKLWTRFKGPRTK